MDSFKAKDYHLYLERDFRLRWLRPDHLSEKLKKYIGLKDFLIQNEGYSVEGRDINSVRWGNGAVKILAWTQMHGNESTATMAIIDLMNFLAASDHYKEHRDMLRSKVQITIVPVLNPDGAEAFTRRNALNIDPNRDALAQQTPEMQTLLKVVKELEPDWCFNLHDQRNIFSAGDTDKTATISFLAASADVPKTLTKTRKLSMSLIGEMYKAISEMLPGHVGRYTDEYYHRALGEYFHKNDIPCILMESGAYRNDPARDMARKANFLGLIKAFEIIAKGEVKPEGINTYQAIPENSTNMLDLVVKDCELKLNGHSVKFDIGLLYEEKPNFETKELDRYYLLNDLGDLQYQFGIDEVQGGLLTSPYDNLKIGSPANFTITLKNNTTLQFKNGLQQ
mgnify:CR=1 FL=1